MHLAQVYDRATTPTAYCLLRRRRIGGSTTYIVALTLCGVEALTRRGIEVAKNTVGFRGCDQALMLAACETSVPGREADASQSFEVHDFVGVTRNRPSTISS